MTKAQVARRAGISAAYLTTLEQGKAAKVSVPVVRGIADAIPGASRAELLELAGYEDDAIYDRMNERRAATAPPDPPRLTPAGLVAELRRLLALLEDSEEQPDDGGGLTATRLRVVPPGTPGTDTPGTARTEGTEGTG